MFPLFYVLVCPHHWSVRINILDLFHILFADICQIKNRFFIVMVRCVYDDVWVSHPVIHKRAKSTGTMRKYPGFFAINIPNLKNDLLSVLSTHDTPQVIYKKTTTKYLNVKEWEEKNHLVQHSAKQQTRYNSCPSFCQLNVL